MHLSCQPRVEVKAGDLVRVRTQEELQQVEVGGAGTSAAAAAAGSSGRAHGASGGGGKRGRARWVLERQHSAVTEL